MEKEIQSIFIDLYAYDKLLREGITTNDLVNFAINNTNIPNDSTAPVIQLTPLFIRNSEIQVCYHQDNDDLGYINMYDDPYDFQIQQTSSDFRNFVYLYIPELWSKQPADSLPGDQAVLVYTVKKNIVINIGNHTFVEDCRTKQLTRLKD